MKPIPKYERGYGRMGVTKRRYVRATPLSQLHQPQYD
jgi:hypothetical protein